MYFLFLSLLCVSWPCQRSCFLLVHFSLIDRKRWQRSKEVLFLWGMKHVNDHFSFESIFYILDMLLFLLVFSSDSRHFCIGWTIGLHVQHYVLNQGTLREIEKRIREDARTCCRAKLLEPLRSHKKNMKVKEVIINSINLWNANNKKNKQETTRK